MACRVHPPLGSPSGTDKTPPPCVFWTKVDWERAVALVKIQKSKSAKTDFCRDEKYTFFGKNPRNIQSLPNYILAQRSVKRKRYFWFFRRKNFLYRLKTGFVPNSRKIPENIVVKCTFPPTRTAAPGAGIRFLGTALCLRCADSPYSRFPKVSPASAISYFS